MSHPHRSFSLDIHPAAPLPPPSAPSPIPNLGITFTPRTCPARDGGVPEAQVETPPLPAGRSHMERGPPGGNAALPAGSGPRACTERGGGTPGPASALPAPPHLPPQRRPPLPRRSHRRPLTSLPLPPPPRERRGRRRLLHAGGPAAPDSPTPPPPCRGRPRLAGAAHCVNCVTAATQPAVATATRGAGRGGAAWWRPAVAPLGGAVPGRARIPAGNSRWDPGRPHLLRAEASAGLGGSCGTEIIAERSH